MNVGGKVVFRGLRISRGRPFRPSQFRAARGFGLLVLHNPRACRVILKMLRDRGLLARRK
jgi:hypothetical protein